jgi:hypothetical protein
MNTGTKFKIRYNTPEGKTKWFDCVQIKKGIKPKNSNEMYLHEDTISQLLENNNLKINYDSPMTEYFLSGFKINKPSIFVYVTNNV